MGVQSEIKMFKVIATEIFKSKAIGSDITQVKIRTNTGVYPGRTFGGGKLRGFDIAFNPGKKEIQLRLLEQNPDKLDKYMNRTTNAVLAAQGRQIVWIIRRDIDEFIGKLMDDGKGDWLFTKSESRALTTATYKDGGYVKQNIVGQDQYNQEYNQYDTGDFAADLPEIDPNDAAIYIAGV